MKQFFKPEYIVYIFIFCIFWNYQWQTLPPWFLVSGPTVIASILLVGMPLVYISSNKFSLKQEHPITYYTFWAVFIYGLIAVPVSYTTFGFDHIWRKMLISFGVMSMVGCTFFMSRPDILQRITRFFFRYFWVQAIYNAIFCVISIAQGGFCVFYLMFYKLTPKNRRWILFIPLLLLLFAPAWQRIMMFRIVVSYLVVVCFLIYNKIPFLKFFSRLFIIAPFFFFTLAATGVFNVMDMESYMGEKTIGEENITIDTRTFIYEEALSSSIINNSILFGRSFARGYDSVWQAGRLEKGGYDAGEFEDRVSEAFIPNLYAWMGTFGVVLFFLVFAYASNLAISQSRNRYMPVVGLFVSIQWVVCWIENSNGWISIDVFFMFLQISMCMSSYWRNLTDEEFEYNMRNILAA